MKSILGLLAGPITLAILVGAGLIIHDGWNNSEFAFTLLIGTAGVVSGWLIGFLISPYTLIEEKRFSKLATAIIGFISGYVVSQIQPLISHLFEDLSVIDNPIYGARLLIFLTCLIIGSLNMYTYRLYIGRQSPVNQKEDSGLHQGSESANN